jgi:hypothetical protein
MWVFVRVCGGKLGSEGSRRGSGCVGEYGCGGSDCDGVCGLEEDGGEWDVEMCKSGDGVGICERSVAGFGTVESWCAAVVCAEFEAEERRI